MTFETPAAAAAAGQTVGDIENPSAAAENPAEISAAAEIKKSAAAGIKNPAAGSVAVQDYEIVPVNKIISFSAVDGPGNRTSVFLQGCNFNCRYCHNPETRALCIACGDCVPLCPAGALTLEEDTGTPVTESGDLRAASAPAPEEDTGAPVTESGDLRASSAPAPEENEPERPGQQRRRVHFDPAKCVACDTCIRTCRHDASPRIRWMDAPAVMAQIRRSMPYIRGVTVSGGECTAHPRFLRELFTLCREAGLTTLIDSNGTLAFAGEEELMAVTDGVMLDVKAFGAEDHRTVTGQDNRQVLENAVFLARAGKLTEVRTVVVPELFDVRESVRRTAALLAPYLTVAPIRCKIIAYRPMGVREAYSHYQVPGAALLNELADIARAEGLKEIVIT